MKKKGSIVVAILLLAVGFAAISTTLIINGTTKVSENADDFSVIFTAASLDGQDVYANVISEDKKTITFETNDLKTLNQTSVLNYEVTNNSSNYDANVTVTCVPKEGTTAKYTSIKNELEGNATVVKAKETLTVTLNKTATEEVKEQYVCELTFNATERDTLGETKPTFVSWVPTYFEFGTPTTESVTDYTTLGKNVFAALDTTGTKGVCINDNGLFCIKVSSLDTDNDNTVLALKNHFGESSCFGGGGANITCVAGKFICTANSDANVDCIDNSTNVRCTVDSDSSVNCG